jgi:predicted RNase H-like nuclease (RuvC/YqgF family)
VLIALLTLYILGSSGTLPLVAALDHVKESIEKDVAAGPRRTELRDIIERAEHTTGEAMEKRKTSLHDLLGLVHRWDAQNGDVQAKLEQLRAETGAYQQQMIRYRFELKGKMSREEWVKVFPPKR